jgi:hypothetical protein
MTVQILARNERIGKPEPARLAGNQEENQYPQLTTQNIQISLLFRQERRAWQRRPVQKNCVDRIIRGDVLERIRTQE